jgi:hypothetical protein
VARAAIAVSRQNVPRVMYVCQVSPDGSSVQVVFVESSLSDQSELLMNIVDELDMSVSQSTQGRNPIHLVTSYGSVSHEIGDESVDIEKVVCVSVFLPCCAAVPMDVRRKNLMSESDESHVDYRISSTVCRKGFVS